MKAIYKVTIRNHPELTYHFLRRDDAEAFLEHIPSNTDGRQGYYLTVIPAFTTQEFSFAIKDLAKDLADIYGELPLE